MSNIIQPLRVYDTSDYSFQNKMALSTYIHRPVLLADRDRLIPFTFQREKIIASIDDKFDQIEITSVNAISEAGDTIDLLSYLTFQVHAIDDLQRPYGVNIIITEQITYRALSIIPQLPRGTWYLSIEDDNGGAWMTDKFLSVSPGNEVLFEFRHSDNFMGFVYSGIFYFNMRFAGVTYDTFEVDQIRETYATRTKDSVDKFLKYAPLRGFSSLMDGNLKSMCDLLMHFDTVYVTAETGEKKRIRVMDVTAEPVGGSNQGGVTVKYEEIDDIILSTTDLSSTYLYNQTGSSFEDQSGLNIGGTSVTIGGTPVTIG